MPWQRGRRAPRPPRPSHWPEGWSAVDDDAHTAELDAELKREVSRGHELHGLDLRALGRRDKTDDVLFAFLGSDEVAVVHLTYRKNDRPPWPSTTRYSTYAEFVANEPEDFGL
jgi:hypothetical protein